MHLAPWNIILVAHALTILVLLAIILPTRLRMARRARALLAEHPHTEQTSIYLAFRVARPGAKRLAMDARIAEMATAGWTFLRASEANPLRTLRSWGGGLHLHFIRAHPAKSPGRPR